jgi:hypothetical protein
MKKEILTLLMLLVLCFLASSVAKAQQQEKEIIAYAQNIRVSDLDPTLPKQPVEEWLKSLVGAKAPISWEINDCGEQTGVAQDSGNTNPQTCAQVTSNLEDGQTVGIQIIVGTFKEGIKGKPEVFFIYVENQGEFKSTSKLRELPTLIKK